MREYRFFVKKLADESIDRLFLNSDENHALHVLVNIFEHAKDTVRIFAANLCEHVGNQPEYVEALSEFIERGGKVRILLNAFNSDKALNSNLFKRLAYYISIGNKNIQVKTTKIRPYLSKDPEKKNVHFTVMDEIGYRLETDTESRTAECNFNSPVLAKGMASFFDKIFDGKESNSIDLCSMFNGII